MNIPRIDPNSIRALAEGTDPLDDAAREVLRTAAARLELVQDALFVVLQEAIPSGQRGPFMLSRDTMSKIAAIYSPGIEVLREIALKCERNEKITPEDVDAAMAAMNRVQAGEQGGG